MVGDLDPAWTGRDITLIEDTPSIWISPHPSPASAQGRAGCDDNIRLRRHANGAGK